MEIFSYSRKYDKLFLGIFQTIELLSCIFASNKIKAMQRWQQKQRQRAHHNMVEQAKPTIKRYSKSRQKPNLSSSRSASINLPFHQVLTILQLHKYQPLLVSYGFPQRIKDKQSMTYIDEIMNQVDEQDKDKFYSLMNALLSITVDSKASIRRTPLLKKTKNKNLPPTSTSSNLKKSDSIMNKNCESLTIKKIEKNTHFRIKSKTNIHRESFNSPPISTFTEKIIGHRAKARDDISIIHEINLKGAKTVKFISKANSFLGRIQERLKKIKGYDQKKQKSNNEAKLYYNEIKEMYLSYDSATLTSNIANIDIEEIIQCYAIQIQSHLNAHMLNPEKSYKKEKSNKYHIEKLLKKSLIQNKVAVIATENSYIDDDINETISIGSGSQQEERKSVEESSEMFYLAIKSIASGLSCFNYQYTDEIEGACGRKDIKNFIQLVMMAGKMEKETPIISYAYILRLLQVCKIDRINSNNWKNLTLITLIQASKIWDDQSLENHSFSKVIRPYTTLEINRLQRHLLTLLNYKLQIEPKQYCQSYFRLRKHASSSCKTAHLMHLSLEMIKKLQSGTKKCEKSLKQSYKKKLNQSF